MLSVTPQASPLAQRLVQETVANATSKNNVTGTTGVIYMIDVDNTANVTAVYLKIWDSVGPTVGTTPADWVFKIAASVRTVLSIPTAGLPFAIGLSFAVVTGADQGNAGNPASAVLVRMATT